jgi:transcriptional regulator with XRE-family HTH domain
MMRDAMVEAFIPHIYDNRKFQARGDCEKFTLNETDLPPQICDSLPMMRGEWISNRLRTLGKKKIDFADAIGVPPPRVSDIINGKRIIKGPEISKAANFLECSTEELISALYGTPAETEAVTEKNNGKSGSQLNHHPNRIRQIREYVGFSRAFLGSMIDASENEIEELEKGDIRNQDLIEKIASLFGCIPEYLLLSADDEFSKHPLIIGGKFIPKSKFSKPLLEYSTGIAEVDVRAGVGLGGEALAEYRPDGNGGAVIGDAVRGHWHLPDDYLRVELRAAASDLAIIEVEGDSMTPTLQTGDRVMVNLRARIPSPPGIFALWDGLGVVCKRVEHIQGSDPPLLRIISDNERHTAYERTIDEAHIIGRVVWFARRL